MYGLPTTRSFAAARLEGGGGPVAGLGRML
jgi:hypothetical protein